jgi:glycosyltransferase involved in cell wall biosynthesis
MKDQGRRTGLRIAMALYGDVTFDSRVLREADTLCAAGHAVTIYCLAGSPPEGAPFSVVARAPTSTSVLPDGSSPFLRSSASSVVAKLASRVRWILGYARNLRAWGRWAVDAAGPVDVWHAHDLTGLMAVGPNVRAPARLVYDSHEMFLTTGTGLRLPRPLRRLLSLYEGYLARRAVALVTVNEGYAAVLRKRLRPRRTIIVRNCPPRATPSAMPASRLRDVAGVPDSEALILYHGLFTGQRGIEQVAEAMLVPALRSAHLALLGFGSARSEFERLAREPRFGGRLHVLEAVPPGQLLDWVAGADVDVIPLQHSTLNHWLCTPNKLWESLAVGVPVVVSDFPVMKRVVLEDPAGPLGEVCEPASPESIAAAIAAIISLPETERSVLRTRCLEAAHQRWNWETESSRLVELYAEILASGS